MWLEIVSRDRQLRSGRVLCFKLASLGPLMSTVAKELKDSELTELSTCRRGPIRIDLRLVWSALNACLNVDAWLLRPMAAASICRLDALLVSS